MEKAFVVYTAQDKFSYAKRRNKVGATPIGGNTVYGTLGKQNVRMISIHIFVIEKEGMVVGR